MPMHPPFTTCHYEPLGQKWDFANLHYYSIFCIRWDVTTLTNIYLINLICYPGMLKQFFSNLTFKYLLMVINIFLHIIRKWFFSFIIKMRNVTKDKLLFVWVTKWCVVPNCKIFKCGNWKYIESLLWKTLIL